MAEVEKIFFPNGASSLFRKEDGERWADVIAERVLPRWERYCNEHWISANHEDIYAAERRVKAFLDRCAYIICKDEPETESKYKAMMRKVREFPVSDCPSSIFDLMYSSVSGTSAQSDADADAEFELRAERNEEAIPISKRPKRSSKKYEATRFEKLSRAKNMLQPRACAWSRVYTDNSFEYGGRRFRIADSVIGYRPKQTAEGVLYDMDSVLIVECADGYHLFDQNIDEISADAFWIEQMAG